jgi:hypothetical protein
VYAALARACGLEITGGSDYHGETGFGGRAPGAVLLPPECFDRLASRAEAARRRGRTP